MTKAHLACAVAAAAILSASAASAAQTEIIDGVTVTDYGRVSPSAPVYEQSGVATPDAQIQIGQVTGPGNPPVFSNPGWDPYGLSDTSHYWWNVEDGSVTIDSSGELLTLVWGSPNYAASSDTNTVSFYSGANGSGALIGTITAADLYADFAGITNTTDPGYLISFVTSTPIGSVVFTTPNASDFEFAVVAGVPEPSAWAMMLVGFAGLGYAGYQRSRRLA
jgi:opacity protein-like surface antigen